MYSRTEGEFDPFILLDSMGSMKSAACIIRKKEKPTAEFKVGDKVRIVKEWIGWEDCLKADSTIGKIGRVEQVHPGCILVYLPENDARKYYSPGALEKVEDQPKYTEADIIPTMHDPRLEGAIGKVCYVASHRYNDDVVANANNDDKYHKGILVNLGYDPASPFEVHTEAGLYWKKIIIDKDQPDSSCSINKEVEDKSEKRYVPFDLSHEKDRARLRDAWIRPKGRLSVGLKIIAMDIDCVFFHGEKGQSTGDLLMEYEFIDGTPCGKLKED